MAKKNQHVVPFGNGWAVKGVGNSKYTAITERKSEAKSIAMNIAKNNKSEMIIHGKDGKILNRVSYNNNTNS